MYFILLQDGTKAFYLFENNDYNIGRKDCDILIKNDTSISRKHALICVKERKIYITDFGAKYKTFVNNVQLEPNMKHELNLHDEIKFGILNSIYIVKEMKINVITSGLTTKEKKVISDVIKKLEGNMLLDWSKECSHLIVREIMLTLKVLCALIESQPVVSLDFWTEFTKRVHKSLPPPNPEDYKPVYAENVLNKNINFKYKPARKSLFKNKIFVFKTNASKMKIEAVVELAGGTCISWNERCWVKETFMSSNPQYLLIQDDQKTSGENDPFMKMVGYLHSIGKRSIPFQEIAMAIVLCSCEKDCNPNFDRTGTLIKKEEIVFTESILAAETQAESCEMENLSIVIPQSLDNDHADVVNESSQCIAKRTGEQLGNDEKKIKLDNIGDKESSDTPMQYTNESCSEDIKPLEAIDMFLNDTNELNLLKKNKKLNKVFSECDSGLKRPNQQGNHNVKKIRLETAGSEKENVQNIFTPAQKLREEKVDGFVDLTSPTDEIITSTQIANNFDDHKKKSANPFGFTRCASKLSKNKTTAKMSDFFKPVSKSNDSVEENIVNISAIDLETPSTSRKRKCSEETSLDEFTFKDVHVRNPFSIKKQFKSRESMKHETPFENLNQRGKETINPFTEVVAKTKEIVKKTTQVKAIDTLLPYTFNVTVVDANIEKNHPWISTSTIKKESNIESDSKTNLDDKLAAIFNDCVVIETIPAPIKDVSVDVSNGISNGKSNFKKFKKIHPKHVQTIIIPKSKYRHVTCNEKEAIDETFYGDDDDE